MRFFDYDVIKPEVTSPGMGASWSTLQDLSYDTINPKCQNFQCALWRPLVHPRPRSRRILKEDILLNLKISNLENLFFFLFFLFFIFFLWGTPWARYGHPQLRPILQYHLNTQFCETQFRVTNLNLMIWGFNDLDFFDVTKVNRKIA